MQTNGVQLSNDFIYLLIYKAILRQDRPYQRICISVGESSTGNGI